jgi:hypothetical protein
LGLPKLGDAVVPIVLNLVRARDLQKSLLLKRSTEERDPKSQVIMTHMPTTAAAVGTR